ncbi:MAG: T9SS type A sorting domain-containing protein [Bacteroidota bacterium]|nr:T9SS type A sorting domain-containing protein [Bacteroidota bacterium]
MRPLSGQVTVTIDSSTHFQTIEGWGHGGGIFSNLRYTLDSTIRDSYNFQYLDFIAHDLGLTGSRMWEVGPRIDGTGMDNGDCDSIDWTKFRATVIDSAIGRYAVYFKDLVEAEGYHTSFYSSPTYATAATAFKPWVMNHPGERAQQIWADALWWKQNFGIDINYDVIFNEPSGSATPQLIADDIKALGPRLLSHGLATKTQYAEAVSPQTDWNYITPVANDSDLWPFIGRLSYHTYGTADPYRADIRDFGAARGIPTAQTEMGNPTIDDLFGDLTLGGVTYWEIAFAGQNTLAPIAGNTGFTPSSTYFRLRQVLHYVRPGDMRIGATSSDSTIRVLAFTHSGEVTTVLLNGGSVKSVILNGLPPGSYGVSQSAPGTTFFKEFGIQSVGADGKLTVNIGGSGSATTVYPYTGPNHAPTIMSFTVNPGYVVAPTTSATLTCKANDAELDPLTYAWSVVLQPAGASASFASPANATTAVNNLIIPGPYEFKVSVSDGTNTSSKNVYLIVYASNPPPMIGQAGFRFAAPYGLVFSDPGDTTHANVELPVSSAILQVGIGDLANSDFSGRGKWTLVSQPAGANAKVDTTIYIFISIRAQVTNMTVPGDYVFHVAVTNPGHPDLTSMVICTVHPASTGPVINSISANPAKVTLPESSTQLTASTSDPQGQLLRHWWVIKSAPAGAKPVFDHQGLANTGVSGLTVPGNYTLTLRAFDDVHMTTKDVTVTVTKPSGGVTSPSSDDEAVSIYPNPFSEEINISIPGGQNSISRLVVVNALGQKLLEKRNIPLLAGIATVSLRSLPTGIYSLLIQTDGGMILRKLVKQ